MSKTASNQLDNPGLGNWAGSYQRPLPTGKPSYWTDIDGGINWNVLNPCSTWGAKNQKFIAATGTLEQHREAMYDGLPRKLAVVYR